MILASLAYAQKIQTKDVPDAVRMSLHKRYPNASKVEWENEKGNYEASFELSEAEYSILLNNTGSILETEVEITTDELPANIKAYVSEHYAGQKIKEAARITDAKGNVSYEAEIKGKELIFDSTGNFITETRKKND